MSSGRALMTRSRLRRSGQDGRYRMPPSNKRLHPTGARVARSGGCDTVTDTLVVRRFSAAEWPVYRDLRLRALGDSPDAFGSTLSEETGRTDAQWAGCLAAASDSQTNLQVVAEVDGEPVGLAWGRVDPPNPEVAVLYQMWVAPSHRGVGAGKMLLEAVIAWARARNASFLDLGVTCGNSPARRLYERAGFKPVGEPQPLRPGSELVAQSMRLALRGAPE